MEVLNIHEHVRLLIFVFDYIKDDTGSDPGFLEYLEYCHQIRVVMLCRLSRLSIQVSSYYFLLNYILAPFLF